MAIRSIKSHIAKYHLPTHTHTHTYTPTLKLKQLKTFLKCTNHLSEGHESSKIRSVNRISEPGQLVIEIFVGVECEFLTANGTNVINNNANNNNSNNIRYVLQASGQSAMSLLLCCIVGAKYVYMYACWTHVRYALQ